MDIQPTTDGILDLQTEALVVTLSEDVNSRSGIIETLNQAMDNAIANLIENREITGKQGEITLLHTYGGVPSKRLVIVGIGKQDNFNIQTIRRVSGEVARFLRRRRIGEFTMAPPDQEILGFGPKHKAEAMVEGVLLGLYQFTHHKAADQDIQPMEQLRIWSQRQMDIADIEQGISHGRVLSEAISLCRDLVNEPSNHMTPTQLAIVATEIAQEGSLEISVLDKAQLEELGMGAILGVARGSHEPPKFIILRYWGDRENPDNNIALIGKGITFDSGGISIKPAAGMGAMKGDMAGAAAVLAAIKAISHLDLRLNVTVLAACTENLPGGGAQKPGDVIRAMNNKTIEVENTDAEGRLVLADALSYARHIGITRLVDVATLTGAIRTTLGTAGTGVFGTNQGLVDRIIKASHHTGEKMWQLPLWEEFKVQNASQVADIKNTGGAAAGSATAAWFLAEFAGDTPWIHLDIAGTATSDTTRGERVKGATGTPVRTLVAFIQDLASS